MAPVIIGSHHGENIGPRKIFARFGLVRLALTVHCLHGPKNPVRRFFLVSQIGYWPPGPHGAQ